MSRKKHKGSAGRERAHGAPPASHAAGSASPPPSRAPASSPRLSADPPESAPASSASATTSAPPELLLDLNELLGLQPIPETPPSAPRPPVPPPPSSHALATRSPPPPPPSSQPTRPTMPVALPASRLFDDYPPPPPSMPTSAIAPSLSLAATHEGSSALEVVATVLHSFGWEAERFDDDDGWTSFVTRVEDGVVTTATVARVLEASSRFVLYAILAPRAADRVRGEVHDFILRANYGLPDGNFEIDPENGEVRFKVSIDFCGMDLDPLLVRNAVLDAGAVIEGYGPGLARVLRGEISARAAIALAEAADDGPA